MTKYFTAKYTPIESGFMGQIIEWPEVVTEGESLDDCRESLIDALREMSLANGEIGKEVPFARALFEQIPVEV
jgi:predicted RNase H-like HicB family nuclease